METVVCSLIIAVLVLAGIATAILIRNMWLDMKARKQLDEVVDIYLEVTRLKYRAMLDALAKEDDGR